jgi:hypothetical protein
MQVTYKLSRFSDRVQIRLNGINELCKLNEKIRQAGSHIDANILDVPISGDPVG